MKGMVSMDLQVMMRQPDECPFPHEEVFMEIANHVAEISTDSDESCFLVTDKMAILLNWEDDKVVIEKVLKASDVLNK